MGKAAPGPREIALRRMREENFERLQKARAEKPKPKRAAQSGKETP